LQDRAEPYRYEQDELILILNTAMTEIKRLRPDAFAGTLLTANTPQFHDPADGSPPVGYIPTTDPWPIDEQFLAPVIEYIAAYAEFRDDEFVDGAASSESGRATLFMQRWVQRLVAGTF
jgi:hypothetical protein